MKIVLLLVLLTVSGSSSSRAVGHTGQSVTLPCSYDRKHHGALEVCWGRGELPLRGCNNQLVSIDRYNVTRRASSRFQLLGRLEEGDVSLTILNLTEEDEGRYGCRVEIRGLFNDEKHHIDLIVEGPSPTTPQTPEPERSTAAQTAAGPMMTGTVWTSSSSCSPSSELDDHQDKDLMPVLVCVLFLLVVLVTAGGLFIIVRRWRRLKLPKLQVQVGSTASTMQLHHQGSTVENIYQVDGGVDTGDYELCP